MRAKVHTHRSIQTPKSHSLNYSPVHPSSATPDEPRLSLFWQVAAILFSAWATFHHLGNFDLLTPDEGRNAEVAREMMASGAWLVPTYDGATYLDKPAFFFKAVALSLSAFGNTEFAARFPSALFGFGLLMMVFAFCRRAYGERTAALAMIVVATTPLFMAFSRIVIFDMTLAFFVCGAIFSAFLAEDYDGRQRRNWYLLATLSAGLATLVKGPVGFLVPLLVMAVHHWVSGRTRTIRRFFAPAHIGLFLAVVLPWFVGLSLACPDFPYYGIMKESIARFTTTEFRRTQPFYYYAVIIAGGFFAWSLVLPEGMRLAWRERRQLNGADRLFAVWAIVVVIFFSLSQSKLPGYILTGVVALGVLVARVFVAALNGQNPAAQAWVRRASLGLALVAGLLTVLLLLVLFAPAGVPGVNRLQPETLSRFGSLLPLTAMSMAITAVLAGVAYGLRSAAWALAAFLSFPVLLLTANFAWVERHAGIKSARTLLNSMPAQLPANTEFACDHCLPHGLPFYLERPVTVFTEDGRELTSNYVIFSLASGKPWSEHLVPAARMREYLAARPNPVYLIARGYRQGILEELAKPHGGSVQSLGNDYVGTLLPAKGR